MMGKLIDGEVENLQPWPAILTHDEHNDLKHILTAVRRQDTAMSAPTQSVSRTRGVWPVWTPATHPQVQGWPRTHLRLHGRRHTLRWHLDPGAEARRVDR